MTFPARFAGRPPAPSRATSNDGAAAAAAADERDVRIGGVLALGRFGQCLLEHLSDIVTMT